MCVHERKHAHWEAFPLVGNVAIKNKPKVSLKAADSELKADYLQPAYLYVFVTHKMTYIIFKFIVLFWVSTRKCLHVC